MIRGPWLARRGRALAGRRRGGAPAATPATPTPARPRGFGMVAGGRRSYDRARTRPSRIGRQPGRCGVLCLRRRRNARDRGRALRARIRIILLSRFEARGSSGIWPVRTTYGRFALRREPDPIEHSLDKLDEELVSGGIGDHGNSRVGLEPVPHLGSTLDRGERALPAQRPKRASNLFELHGVRGAERDPKHRLDGKSGKIAGQGDEVRAPALLNRFGGHPQRGAIPGQQLDAADVREHPVGRRTDGPPRVNGHACGQARGYRESSSRIRRVPSTIEASLATVSSTVRVLSPQSGVTYT